MTMFRYRFRSRHEYIRELIMFRIRSIFLLLLITAAFAYVSQADSEDQDGIDQAADSSSSRVLTADDLKTLKWRSIGPANMAGRLATIALAPGNSKTFYIGYATGGLWKTTNNGTTFTPVFDEYETSSIGAVVICDAPSDWPGWETEKAKQGDSSRQESPEERGKAKIIWVGTGEGNGRNSSSWGHGVYRSTDSGSSFKYLGLKNVHDIPALAVDPRDPDTCFVAGLGHLWGANEERGVFRTTDGGKTWEKVLYIDDSTGACDVVIDPVNPENVYAAMYMRRRGIGSFQSGGSQGGIYKSTDGGDTWKKVTKGLPQQTGRIGLAVYTGDPAILYATVESDQGGRIKSAWNDRSRFGGVFRSDDHGSTWKRMSDFNPRAFYFSRIRVDPSDDKRVYLLGWQLYVSDDAGKTFRGGVTDVVHVDFHAMAIDPADPDHLLVGTDGGLYVSYDKGKTWDFHNEMAVGQFYKIAVDMSDPYRVGGGLQDNGSWIGISGNIKNARGDDEGRGGGITNADWDMVWWGDGLGLAFDPTDPDTLYVEWQGGGINR
ncbi:MAG TPA: hypothetical protein ENJ06_03525, partial [Phycisphaeraceae bacterium]|nr:hypothetical protein [Phycisphaeraceae bacterium]